MTENSKNPDFKAITDDALEEVVGGSFGPTAHIKLITSKTYNMWIGTSPDQIVFYGAGWCGPCYGVNDTLELLAADNPNYEVAVIDVDENPEFYELPARIMPETQPDTHQDEAVTCGHICVECGKFRISMEGQIDKNTLTALIRAVAHA